MNKVPGLNSNVFFDPVGLPFSQVSSEVPFPTGAIAYYKLDEASGSVIDSVNGYNGTNNGAVPNVTGKINTAYNFDGINDYISMGNVFNFERTDAFSFSFWVNTPLNSLTFPLAKQADSFNYEGYMAQINPGGKILFFLRSDINTNNFIRVRASTPIIANTWSFIVITYDGSSLVSGVNIYIDGVKSLLENTIDSLTGSIITPTNFNLGLRGDPLGANVYEGLLDEVGVWTRALSATEIAYLYNNGNGKTYLS